MSNADNPSLARHSRTTVAAAATALPPDVVASRAAAIPGTLAILPSWFSLTCPRMEHHGEEGLQRPAHHCEAAVEAARSLAGGDVIVCQCLTNATFAWTVLARSPSTSLTSTPLRATQVVKLSGILQAFSGPARAPQVDPLWVLMARERAMPKIAVPCAGRCCSRIGQAARRRALLPTHRPRDSKFCCWSGPSTHAGPPPAER